uniref:Putative heat shock transcription factor hsf n=1 Tax=Corethrella appendiculata TaxID=1370023 RepID=U5EZQ6_9DIPT
MHTFSESGTGVPAFLAKLWRLVEDPETNDLISWSTDGRSFVIQNQAQFAKELLPLNYKHNNMASFIRQLNMYGFHKITSIDNGGLRFDRDEMEFTHPCFQKEHPYLLEHIKRKIANPKQTIDDKSGLKVEAVNKVLSEVKNIRGRQEVLDTSFGAIKAENEALWREVAVLRQKHLKQQQIVNKLIHFLVTIVQPSRTGLGSMNPSNNKRRFQLMINDAPQSSKMKKTNNDNQGARISELSEALEEAAYENEDDMINSELPNVQSPLATSQTSPIYRPGSQNEFIEEIISPSQLQYNSVNVKQEHFDPNQQNVEYVTANDNSNFPDCGYQILYENDDNISNDIGDDHFVVVNPDDNIDTVNMELYNPNSNSELNTPLIEEEIIQPQFTPQSIPKIQQQQQPKKIITKDNNKQSILKINARNNGASSTGKKKLSTNGKNILIPATATTSTIAAKPLTNVVVTIPTSTTPVSSVLTPTTSNKQLFNASDFISQEIPIELFNETATNIASDTVTNNNNGMTTVPTSTVTTVNKQSPMLSTGINLGAGIYNPNINIQNIKQKQPNDLPTSSSSVLAAAVADAGITSPIDDDISSQIRNDALIGSNTLAPAEKANKSNNIVAKIQPKPQLKRMHTVEDYDQQIDTVQNDLDSLKDLLRGEGYQLDANTLLGLFGGNEDLLGYDFPLIPDPMAGKKSDDEASTSQLMSYNPTAAAVASSTLTAPTTTDTSSNDYIDLYDLLTPDPTSQAK